MSEVKAVPGETPVPDGGVIPELSTPVETPVEVVVETVVEPTPTPVEDPVNKRFSEVTRQRDEALKRERDSQAQLNAALEALNRVGGGVKPAVEKKPEPAEVEPQPPEFLDPEQYQRDMAVYATQMAERAAKNAVKAAEVDRERQRIEEQNKETQQRMASEWEKRRTAALTKYADYAEVAESPDVPISPAMALAIVSSEHGAEVAYHLGKHPELASKLASLSPTLQLLELGKLEVQLTTPKPPAVSKAPPPIKPLSGSGEPQTKSLDELSMDEYAAQRKKSH